MNQNLNLILKLVQVFGFLNVMEGLYKGNRNITQILRYYYIYNKYISHLCLLPSHTPTFPISAVQHSSKHLFALPKKIPQFRKTFFEIGLLLPLMHVNFT